MEKVNTFFLKEAYETEIGLDVNEDVLKRIYDDDILPSDLLIINFAFITDTFDKASKFEKVLKETFKNYTDIIHTPYGELFEIAGKTNKIKMILANINKWNLDMWDFGYAYDCKLDGWYIGRD